MMETLTLIPVTEWDVAHVSADGQRVVSSHTAEDSEQCDYCYILDHPEDPDGLRSPSAVLWGAI